MDRPSLELECMACHAKLELTPIDWQRLFDKRNFVKPELSEGETRAWSLRSSELDVTMRFGPQPPLCAACGARMDLSTCKPEMEGNIFCGKCGAPMGTFPAPEWLRAVDKTVRQIFGAPRAPAGQRIATADAAKPVSFSCPDCGGHLKITAESPRVVACSYCAADLFVPDALWRAIHPLKKRSPWYVAFG